MSRRTKVGLAVGLLIGAIILIGSVVAARSGDKAVEARLEEVAARDLVSIVTASGKIEAKTKVDISADITGRITQIAVREGEMVTRGQFLLQIDPAQYESAVARVEALLASSEASLVQARTNRDQARRGLDRAIELRGAGTALISAEALEQAQQAFDVADATFQASQAQVNQSRASLQEARDNLAKTRLTSPINGRVVRLNVEEGEVAVPGTFSRETGLLMTVADLSVIMTKVFVDETDVVRLKGGDSVSVEIDAFPDTSFSGRVTKVSNSARLTAAAGGDQAVDFEVEVTLDDPPADIRPDLSATARIVTDTRLQALSVPIIALTVRQHEDVASEYRAGSDSARARKDREGVFVIRGGVATFQPVRIGIAGDEYFEVLSGVQRGDSIVAGPYQVVRDMKDSARVRPAPAVGPGAGGTP
ncbi:MAG TPA: efflux RND transporter periplasmic adaptor subunit [Gemmatimonadales bacterium]|nr:efflux RND transporter periplasmic adaptor subunit [Gemmatimonadales bacterium]